MPRWTIRRRWLWLAGTLLLAAMAALLAGRIAERRAFGALVDAAAADAPLRAALLDSEVARYRLLPLALADDRDVVAGLADPAAAGRRLNRKLEALAAATGAPVIYVVSPEGRAIAASNWRTPSSFVGRDYRFRGYFQDARAHGDGEQFARGTVSRRPGLFLSHRTASGGVAVVKLDFDAIEHDWAEAGGETFVTGPSGVVLVSSRRAWRFATTRPLTPAAAARFGRTASIPAAALRPLPLRPSSDGRGVLGRARYVAATAATAQRGWTLTLLRRETPAVRFAAHVAQAAAAAAVLALAATLALVLGRRARARRHTDELEAAVAQRTADLEREMEERAAGEARAADLREGLRQANRLASLGQITASVAHETAQPVMAIRTYAQTSAMLLDRDDDDAVRENLAAIARLADRIGTVTAELRGFARRGAREVRPVALAEIVDGARLILRDQLKPIAVDVAPIAADLRVMGGRVRLEQVVVNLLQNAAEALRDTAAPRIALEVTAEPAIVRLLVADNGPGIPPAIAARLFTPFVTSRENGLGLGLVIAQDIMTDLGGALRVAATAAGAAFEIEMRRA